MTLLYALGLVVFFACLYFVSEQVEDAWQTVAYNFRLPASLAGATLLAVSSSLPEFFTSLNGALLYHTLEIGFMTIIWSAIFNILVITGIVGVMSTSPLTVSKNVIIRDSLVYLAALIVLILLLSDGEISLVDACVLLITYLVYVVILYLQRHSIQEGEEVSSAHASKRKIIVASSAGTAAICLLSAGIVYLGVELSYALGVSLVVISALVFSIGTSIPDLLLSYFSAKRGGGSMAISNVFGSNTFDITVCLGVPALVLLSNESTIEGDLPSLKLSLLLLFIAMLLVNGLLAYNFKVTRIKGWICLVSYVCFVATFFYAMEG
jgi:cation:H+ antiporter